MLQRAMDFGAMQRKLPPLPLPALPSWMSSHPQLLLQ